MQVDYGKQVGKAFAAVHLLHHDVSRLLTDVAPKWGVNRRVENAVITGLSGMVRQPLQWMPYSVCMTSSGGDLPRHVVESLMVYFWRPPPAPPQEPHLIVARLTYKADENGRIDPWYWDTCDACFKWTDLFPVEVVNRFTPNNDRVESVSVTAVTLFSVTSVDDVLKLMEEVRDRAAQG